PFTEFRRVPGPGRVWLMIRRLREGWLQVGPAVRLLPWTLGLLWRSHWPGTIAVSLITLAQGVVPVGQLWVTKLLVDQIVLGLTLSPGQRADQVLSTVFIYLALEAGVILAGVL